MNDIIPIGKDAIVAEAQKMLDAGQRLITMTAVDLMNGKIDLLYHFDKDLSWTNYRMTVSKDEAVPSISGVYFAALLVENEMKDQFGLNFEGLALDFGGHLYLADETITAPFCKISIKKS